MGELGKINSNEEKELSRRIAEFRAKFAGIALEDVVA
jgi:hypothetical protein